MNIEEELKELEQNIQIRIHQLKQELQGFTSQRTELLDMRKEHAKTINDINISINVVNKCIRELEDKIQTLAQLPAKRREYLENQESWNCSMECENDNK